MQPAVQRTDRSEVICPKSILQIDDVLATCCRGKGRPSTRHRILLYVAEAKGDLPRAAGTPSLVWALQQRRVLFEELPMPHTPPSREEVELVGSIHELGLCDAGHSAVGMLRGR